MSLASAPTLRRSTLVLSLAAASAAIVAACTSPTGPGSNCDPNAGFNFRIARTAILIEKPEVTRLDIEVTRDTATGPVQFDILRGPRVYGSDLWLSDTLALFVNFLPNPVPAGGLMTRVEFQHMGTDLQTYTNERMAIRGFIGSGPTAKECFREIQVTLR